MVRPHPDREGRYQLAYGHNRLEACRRAGITEADLQVIPLSDYDMLCCMIDENLTQQHIEPKTVFEIVAVAIKEAEKMLRETNTVYEFNARFKRSRGLPTLLQKSHCPGPDNVIFWRDNEYQKAKEAIEPGGHGLGRGFIQHFLPAGAVPRAETLQTAIAAYSQETEIIFTSSPSCRPTRPFLGLWEIGRLLTGPKHRPVRIASWRTEGPFTRPRLAESVRAGRLVALD